MTMVADLPKRPEPGDDVHRIVEPTERVRSVADKVDPRFAAARSRADRQEALRARHKVGGETPVDADDTTDDQDDTTEETKPGSAASDEPTAGTKKSPFSFNLTADEPKDEQ